MHTIQSFYFTQLGLTTVVYTRGNRYVAVVYSDIADGSVRGVLWTVRSAVHSTPRSSPSFIVVPLAPWPYLIRITTSESVLSSTFTGDDSMAPYFTNRGATSEGV